VARTVWYLVAELVNPAAEPFAVLRVDTSVRKGDGVEGEVVSLHRERDEADARAAELTDEYLNEPCPYCGHGQFTGLPGNACENCMNTGLAHPEQLCTQ
jgi:hypothetical protein